MAELKFGEQEIRFSERILMADHLRPFSDFIIFVLKLAKMIKSESGLKWTAIKILYDKLIK